MTTAAIYARVSTDEQKYNFSLPTQLEGCREYAQQRGHHVLREFCEDYTGTALERPELDNILRLAADGAIDTVIVYEIDRLARGMAKQIILEEDFSKRGVTVCYVLADYGDNPEGRLQKNVRATIAEYEREKLLQRTRRGARGRAKAGHVLMGGLSLYGYQYSGNSDKREGRLIIIEREATIIRLIFQWYVIGDETGKRLGTQAIARKLSEMRVPTRCDDWQPMHKTAKRGMWAKSAVNRILHNETYAGTWHYDKTQTLPDGTRVPRDPGEWLAVAVPAIVDRDIWEAAQRQMTHNLNHSPRRTKEPYLMRSRLRCAKCGFTFTATTDKRNGFVKRYYCCPGQKRFTSKDHKTKTCNHYLQVDRIDSLVQNGLKAVLRNPRRILNTLGQEKAEREKTLTLKRSLLATAEQEIAAREEERLALLRRHLRGKLSEEMLDSEEMRIDQEIAALTADRDKLSQEIADTEISAEQVQAVETFCRERRNGLEHYTFEDWQDAVDLLNVQCRVMRGATPDDDEILMEGYFPAVMLSASGNSATMIVCHDDRKTAVPFSLILKVSQLAA